MATEMKYSSGLSKLSNLFWLFSSLFICLFVWAFNFELDKSVNMSGEIKPKGMPLVLQNRFEGKILKIHVENGEFVQRHQQLISFETSIDVAELEEIQNIIVSSSIVIARLQAQLKRQDTFTSDYKKLVNENGASFSVIQNQLAEQRQELLSELLSFDNQLKALSSERRVKESQIQMLSASSDSSKVQIEISVKKHALTKNLYDRGFEGQITLMEAEGDVLNSKKQFEEAKTQLQLARDEIKFIEDQERSAIADFERETIKQLNVKRDELRKAVIRKNGTAAKMKEFELLAPKNGTISVLNAENPGQVFGPGDTLVELIPESTPLVFYGKLPIQYIKEVDVGLDAKVTPSTLDSRQHLPLDAKIFSVAPDVTYEENKEAHYSVVFQFTEGQQNLKILKSGVTGTVAVLLGKRTVFEYYFDTILKMFSGALSEV
jgi:HlyD family type I secretion membrane fusion protein